MSLELSLSVKPRLFSNSYRYDLFDVDIKAVTCTVKIHLLRDEVIHRFIYVVDTLT